MHRVNRIQDWLFQSVPGEPLAMFRYVFGLLMLYEVQRIWKLVAREYLATACPFRFDFFHWLPTPNADAFYVLLAAMGIAAICLSFGWCYRIAAGVWFLGYTYVFLLEQTLYNNHYYFISLLSFLFAVTRANCCLTMGRRYDARSSTDIPRWQLFLFQAQVFLVYFYAGIAKLNWDWLRGEPMRHMLTERTRASHLATWLTNDAAVYFFAYGGLLFDLSVGFLLIFRKTRPFAIFLVFCFHLTNLWLFDIGVFPFLGIGATLLFLDGYAIRRKLQRVFGISQTTSSDRKDMPPVDLGRSQQLWITAFVATYLTVQVLVPLRHFLLSGNVSWTEEGHNFSWHMKLRSKDGIYRFYVVDVDGRSIPVDQSQFLTDKQQREIATRPRLLLRFADFLRRHYENQAARDGRPVSIHVHAIASLNGRPYQYLIDPTIDLGAIGAGWSTRPDWIVPLEPTETIGDYPETLAERTERMQQVLLRGFSGRP